MRTSCAQGVRLVVVAQLAERSLPIPQATALIQSLANFYIEHLFTVN